MRVSIGTAHVLGLKEIKVDALPTTAYLMHGEGCRRNCQFCSQAAESKSDSRMLSRVVWPHFDLQEVAAGLKKAAEEGRLKRSCIQAVDDGEEAMLTDEIAALVGTGLPLCVSKSVKSLDEIRVLLEMGVDRVTIALDGMNPDVYREIKGGSFEARMAFLLEAAQAFPGRIGTHVIVGLGETEAEAVRLISELAAQDVHVALFAFTPLKGTPMAGQAQPAEGTYRRIQIAHYLIMEHGYRVEDFQVFDGWLSGFNRPKDIVLGLLRDGKAFQTSGCPDCNRPYYNERPGGVLYNYPRSLVAAEVCACLKASKLWTEEIYAGICG
jgi:biotin synthase